MTEEATLESDPRTEFRKLILYCMMEAGQFEPHTIEEAERRLDAHNARRRVKQLDGFDPCI